jgi:glycerol uptake facilitator-like aquaporin
MVEDKNKPRGTPILSRVLSAMVGTAIVIFLLTTISHDAFYIPCTAQSLTPLTMTSNMKILILPLGAILLTGVSLAFCFGPRLKNSEKYIEEYERKTQ